MKQNKHKTRSTGKAIQFFSFFNFPSISTILSPKSWRKTKPQIWHQAVLICRHLKVVSLCCHMSMTSDVCKTKLLTLYFYISNFPSCWQTFWNISKHNTKRYILCSKKLKEHFLIRVASSQLNSWDIDLGCVSQKQLWSQVPSLPIEFNGTYHHS